MEQESADALGLNRPNKPEHEENCGHRCRHIEIGVAAAQKRPIDMKGACCWIIMSPANRSDARNEAEPIHEQNEDEDRGEKPKRLFDQIATDDVLKKLVKALHQPFPKILRSAWNRFDVTHC